MIDLTTIPRKTESFTERQLGEETIFLSPKGDEIHSLDEVGTFIWQLVDGTKDLGMILDCLCDEYDVEIEQARGDLLEFARELVERELLLVD